MNSITITGPDSFNTVKSYVDRFKIKVRVSKTVYKDVTLVKGESAVHVGRAFSDVGWTIHHAAE
jgi:hypothetical protein